MLKKIYRLLQKEDFRKNPFRAIWRRTFWRIHWRLFQNRPFIIPFYGNMKIRLANSSASLGIYLNEGFSDRMIAEKFIHFLKPGMIAVDCGAHIGEYTLLFAHLVGSNGRVYAFEPDPRVFKILKENVTLNNLRNIVLNNIALSDFCGEMEFLLNIDPTASSLVKAGNRIVGRVRVPVTTLDAFIQENKITKIDAIKIDVEGAEEPVLSGAKEVLSCLKPGLIVVECELDLEEPERIGSFLKNFGYRISTITEKHLFTILVAERDEA
jgi:FkbM family methyltransferase